MSFWYNSFGLAAGKEVIAMNDAEVALELLKLAMEHCADAADSVTAKDGLLSLYRECFAAVRGEKA